jgi:zinc protease
LSDEEITIVRRCRLAKALACLVIALLIIAWAGLLNAMPPVQRSVRPNGLVLLTSEEHSLPFVTFSLLIHAGARRDPTGQEGLANLTARALLFGTAKLSMTTINEQLDFMGASLSSNAGMDYAVISLRVLKKDLKAGFKLFTEVLTEPAFPTAEVQKEVNRTLAAIKASEDDPGDVAEKAFMKTLYGTGPYAHPVIGTKESVERLKPQGLRDFYRSHYHPNNAIMVIVGDIGDEDLKKAILPQLEQWKAGDVRKSVAEASYETGKKTVMIDRPLTQANLILGHKGITRDNADFYAITVMNYILGGGGLTSRLMEEVRDKRGLAYSVYSHFDAGKYQGSFQVVLQTKNASAREAIQLAVTEVSRIRTELVSDNELEGAKKYLIGSFPLRFTTQGKIAGFLMQVEYQGLGFDYVERYPKLIEAVTAQDVLRVAKAYLHLDSYILIVVANLKEAGLEQ